jgi:hypothetical protein
MALLERLDGRSRPTNSGHDHVRVDHHVAQGSTGTIEFDRRGVTHGQVR